MTTDKDPAMTTDTADPEAATPAADLTHERIAELRRMLEQDFHADDAWVYTGPLEEGQALAERDRYVVETKTADGATLVLLGAAPDPTWEDHAEFGFGSTPEEAWRFAVGALLSPLVDEP